MLTELCLRSKAVWGYDEDFMRACRDELTLTPAVMRSPLLIVAESGGVAVGLAQLGIAGATARLDKLFVEPTRLHAGIGRRLFEWARSRALKAGATVLVIESDPGALGFYRHMGAVDDGLAPSGSIPGRLIPRLKLPL